jgi:hypothetical protein
MRKKASTEWTMAKLITLVLAVVVLALVIYGVSSNGFGPLIDNMKGRFDSVLILFGIKESGKVSCGDAFDQTIEGVGSGKFYPCTDNCTFVPDEKIGKYDGFAIKEGVFYVRYENEWGSNDMNLFQDDILFYRDFYNSALNFILEKFDKSFEERGSLGSFDEFVLCEYFCPQSYSVVFRGSKKGKVSVTLSFDGEKFIVVSDVRKYYGSDINKAVNVFYSLVNPSGPNDFDIVYYFNSNEKKDLTDLSFFNNVFDDNELDDDDEANALKAFFVFLKNSRGSVSNDNLKILKDRFSGQQLVLDSGEKYEVSVETNSGKFPYIVFSSGSKKIAVAYFSKNSFVENVGFLERDFYEVEENIPLGLYKYEGNGWVAVENINFIKFSDFHFDRLVKINKIYEYFRLRRCGQ